LREGQAIGVDECGQIGGNLRGDFLEFLAGGISAQLEASRWGVGGYGDDGAVARVIGGWIGEFVERLLGSREIVDADEEQHLRSHGFASHEKAAGAISFIRFGKNAEDAQAQLRKRRATQEAASVVASLTESSDEIFGHSVHQSIGAIGGSFFRERVRCNGSL